MNCAHRRRSLRRVSVNLLNSASVAVCEGASPGRFRARVYERHLTVSLLARPGAQPRELSSPSAPRAATAISSIAAKSDCRFGDWLANSFWRLRNKKHFRPYCRPRLAIPRSRIWSTMSTGLDPAAAKIAAVKNQVRRSLAQISQHCLDAVAIAVNIRYDCDPHYLNPGAVILTPNLSEYFARYPESSKHCPRRQNVRPSGRKYFRAASLA